MTDFPYETNRPFILKFTHPMGLDVLNNKVVALLHNSLTHEPYRNTNQPSHLRMMTNLGKSWTLSPSKKSVLKKSGPIPLAI